MIIGADGSIEQPLPPSPRGAVIPPNSVIAPTRHV